MINILKKRYTIGDIVTLHTKNNISFTGEIDSFEDSFVILITEEGEEFIPNDIIERISIPKNNVHQPKKSEIDNNIEKSKIIQKNNIIQNADIIQKLDIAQDTDIVEKLDIVQDADIVEKLDIVQDADIVEKLDTLNKIISNESEIITTKTEIKEYKIGDIIPLEELYKRGLKTNKERLKEAKEEYKKNSTKKQEIIIQGLQSLNVLILPEIEAQNKKILPARGTIIKYFAGGSFGFIIDKFGYEFRFDYSNIIESSLSSLLKGTSYNANIPVIFTNLKNIKGDIATYIHKPKTVEEVILLAKNMSLHAGKIDTPLALMEQILLSYPDNYTAINLKEEIKQKQNKIPVYNTPFKIYDSNYQKAKRLHNVEKNYNEALKYYLLALQNSAKKESCIKDIAMLYVSMGELQKALDFTKKYEIELDDTLANNNHLYNFYRALSVKGLNVSNEVLNITNILLEDIPPTNKVRYVELLSTKGAALIQLQNLVDAREALEEAVSIQPQNTYANRLLEALDEPDNDELSQIIAEAEFDSFGGGFSKFINDTLENYTEYVGIPAKVIDGGDFSNETLSTLRRLIDTAGKARPRERAKYLLTEAKLMTTIEPDRENTLRSVLARYCNAMALNHISENSSMDVIRSYYLEAFSLDERWESVERQVEVFLLSYKSSFSDLLNLGSRHPKINETLTTLLDGDIKDFIWEGLLSTFLWNRSISAILTTKLFENKQFKEKSLIFLSSLSFTPLKHTTIEDYTNLWNQARDKRQRDYSSWLASIKAIFNNENLEILVNILCNSLNEAKKNWLTQLDTSRLSSIVTDIYDVLLTYLRQSGYRDKERSYQFAKAQINQLISEIKEKPTKFSYEGFIPLLEKIELLLEKSFKAVEATSTPVIDIAILGEANVLNNDNIVPFQIKVETTKNSSPIRSIKISVLQNDDIIFLERNNEYFDSVDGGENHIFSIAVRVSNKVAIEKATSINIKCSYITRKGEEPVIFEKQLSLRLYSENEFELIENPYERLANGGPVTNRSMFYGRNEFIDRITQAIISTDSKQVVIYGQKRSGKSSVLYHLKKSLEDTKRTFCISFSIGEIFENISSATFFYKILYTIEEELENLSFDGISVPNFKCPPFNEFKDSPNPADIFRSYIRNFKRICLNTLGWAEIKLVVMIDEFTYLYTAIKQGKVSDAIMKQWKAITQNQDAAFSAVLVGQDIFPLFKSEFPNEFGVTQDERLTYLSKKDALKLIDEPVWNHKANKSRYLEDAADKIIEYTSCSPYYIQIFCARLIKEMNDKKFIEATRSDIKPIAESFLYGGQALTDDKFDNLLNAGEEHDIQHISQQDSKKILRKIAEATRFIPYCSREDINIGDKQYENLILEDLKNREVIEQQGNNYKIQVKLFQEWLLKN